MPPKRNNRRKKYNSNNEIFQLLNRLIRLHSCWNCHQIGHTRHQCPLPKSISCSYCKKPGVRTIDCGCCNQQCLPTTHRHPSPAPMAEAGFDLLVMVPDSNEPNQYKEQDNLMVVIDNCNTENENPSDENTDTEFLELDAEQDSLDDL